MLLIPSIAKCITYNRHATMDVPSEMQGCGKAFKGFWHVWFGCFNPTSIKEILLQDSEKLTGFDKKNPDKVLYWLN